MTGHSYFLFLLLLLTIPFVLDWFRVRARLRDIDHRICRALHAIEEPDRIAEKVEKLLTLLQDKEFQILRQRNEREAVLWEMREGIIAVNPREEVFRMNRAAFELLGILRVEIARTPLDRIVKEPQVLAFARRVLADRASQEREIQIDTGGENRIVHLYARTLLNGEGDFLGVLIVLSDISRLRHLEQLKSDFVANVSHELKTPITSIKGFAETLLGGALENPEEAKRFVGIISKQAERLNTIIDDLLTLSRLEQERGSAKFPPVSARSAVREAVEICEPHARAKQIPIVLEGDDIEVSASAPLLVQAVVNLIDNAIKYSEPGTAIVIRLEELFGGRARLSVIDRGRGIEAQHLPRLFERFYRVEKARGRKEGGTGLGLAIVKHIMQAHGGSAEVLSAPGAGSTFSLTLPTYRSGQ